MQGCLAPIRAFIVYLVLDIERNCLGFGKNRVVSYGREKSRCHPPRRSYWNIALYAKYGGVPLADTDLQHCSSKSMQLKQKTLCTEKHACQIENGLRSSMACTQATTATKSREMDHRSL